MLEQCFFLVYWTELLHTGKNEPANTSATCMSAGDRTSHLASELVGCDPISPEIYKEDSLILKKKEKRPIIW